MDALTRKGKDGGKSDKGKGKQAKGKREADWYAPTVNLKTDWVKEAECWCCGHRGHLMSDCWYNTKGKTTGKDRDAKGSKDRDAKGKGRGHG